jgi:hypothetical protein
MSAVMGFAEQGTRIAIAYWDKIFVWPLNPKALAEKEGHGEVYRKTYDRNMKAGIVALKPIVLDADAVVHKMAFTQSENELVAITDRGLQMWNLGPSATGLRSSEVLETGLPNFERPTIRMNELPFVPSISIPQDKNQASSSTAGVGTGSLEQNEDGQMATSSAEVTATCHQRQCVPLIRGRIAPPSSKPHQLLQPKSVSRRD